jgi:methylated-DNA-[protein]-cysteine S-methyltransferase
MHWTVMDSPIGPLKLTCDGAALTAIDFSPFDEPDDGRSDDDPVLVEAMRQLDEYFDGVRSEFDVSIEPRGTEFQEEVWSALREIPYGRTATYGEIAEAIGRPSAARAVGAAIGRTPTPILVPCHRVIGADGSLVGYGGGLDRKTTLLGIEHR